MMAVGEFQGRRAIDVSPQAKRRAHAASSTERHRAHDGARGRVPPHRRQRPIGRADRNGDGERQRRGQPGAAGWRPDLHRRDDAGDADQQRGSLPARERPCRRADRASRSHRLRQHGTYGDGSLRRGGDGGFQHPPGRYRSRGRCRDRHGGAGPQTRGRQQHQLGRRRRHPVHGCDRLRRRVAGTHHRYPGERPQRAGRRGQPDPAARQQLPAAGQQPAHLRRWGPSREQPDRRGRRRRSDSFCLRHDQPGGYRAHGGDQGARRHDAVRHRGLEWRDPDLHQARRRGGSGMDRHPGAGYQHDAASGARRRRESLGAVPQHLP